MHSKLLNGELLINILFDFIKRRVNFTDLLAALNQIDSEHKLT